MMKEGCQCLGLMRNIEDRSIHIEKKEDHCEIDVVGLEMELS